MAMRLRRGATIFVWNLEPKLVIRYQTRHKPLSQKKTAATRERAHIVFTHTLRDTFMHTHTHTHACAPRVQLTTKCIRATRTCTGCPATTARSVSFHPQSASRRVARRRAPALASKFVSWWKTRGCCASLHPRRLTHVSLVPDSTPPLLRIFRRHGAGSRRHGLGPRGRRVR